MVLEQGEQNITRDGAELICVHLLEILDVKCWLLKLKSFLVCLTKTESVVASV